jgi:precorrin-2 dehydrogenase / sirohydrochlorin ferrochelatase
MPFGYPVFLELQGRRALVVGRGAAAEGKVEGLLAAGASVHVVSDGPRAALDELSALEGVTVSRREFRVGDLDDIDICVASSSRATVRDEIAREARARGVLVNVMDDVKNCDFAAPAVVRRGDLVIAISTGGRSPALAKRLREELSKRFGPEWEEVMRLLGEVRQETLAALPDLPERSKRWSRALDLDEAEELMRQGRASELRARLLLRLTGAESA